MDSDYPEPNKIYLDEIPTKYSYFDFIVDNKQKSISREEAISLKAGDFVGLIYDALLEQYNDPSSEHSLKSLNMLCVRLVFCLYAEDAHIFGNNRSMFHDYMEQFDTQNMRRALIDLFRILNTPEDERDPYEINGLNDFPYVNGGLFADTNIEIPLFTEKIREILLSKASEGFNWSEISPTIFGAVFESTLNPEARRAGGMHYTSIDNIHRVIDPLFIDKIEYKYDSIINGNKYDSDYYDNNYSKMKELERAERNAIKEHNTSELNNIRKKLSSLKGVQTKHFNLTKEKQIEQLKELQEEMASLVFLDPACGSGNFLTETYITLRTIENEIIKNVYANDDVQGQIILGEAINPVKVSISQFYGIEINDFAVTVARTALWIAESQMLKKTEDIIHRSLDFLPLKTNAYIVEGNALRLDWEDIIPKNKLNFIMGNPPFKGSSNNSPEQTEDLSNIFKDISGAGKLDYVACWYKMAASYIKDTNISVAFVSTNSIVQGEQVNILWKHLLEDEKIYINFAYPTFEWKNESNNTAHVYCVIIGFSYIDESNKYLIVDDNKTKAEHINGYLCNCKNFYINSRTRAGFNDDKPPIIQGNKPWDGGHLILSEDERNTLINNHPETADYIKLYLGANEFIKGKKRYCLWLKDVEPSKYSHIKEIRERLKGVVEARKNTKTEAVRKQADTPMLFSQIRQPDERYLAIPEVSGETRRVIPFGFLEPDVIASNKLYMIPGAEIYEFGILESNVHMAWVRTVAGRLGLSYSYSPAVYNNFPWPKLTETSKKEITDIANRILAIRKDYPNSSLADLYDPLTMPRPLLLAHYALNVAVMNAYGFQQFSEDDCVLELMKLYQELLENK